MFTTDFSAFSLRTVFILSLSSGHRTQKSNTASWILSPPWVPHVAKELNVVSLTLFLVWPYPDHLLPLSYLLFVPFQNVGCLSLNMVCLSPQGSVCWDLNFIVKYLKHLIWLWCLELGPLCLVSNMVIRIGFPWGNPGSYKKNRNGACPVTPAFPSDILHAHHRGLSERMPSLGVVL